MRLRLEILVAIMLLNAMGCLEPKRIANVAMVAGVEVRPVRQERARRPIDQANADFPARAPE